MYKLLFSQVVRWCKCWDFVDVIISNATAHCEPPFPAEPSSTTHYPWRPCTNHGSPDPPIFRHTIHPPWLRPSRSAASFYFGIHNFLSISLLSIFFRFLFHRKRIALILLYFMYIGPCIIKIVEE